MTKKLPFTVLVQAAYSNLRHEFATLPQAKRFAAAERRKRAGVYVVRTGDPDANEIPGTEYKP